MRVRGTLLHCRANLICCDVRNQQHAWTKAAAEAAAEALEQAPKTTADTSAEAALAGSVGSASLVRETAL